MSWIEIRATMPALDDLSPFVEVFRDHGVENTREESGPILSGCMVDIEGTQARVEELCDALRAAGATDVTANPFEEENWQEIWKQFFKPRRVGDHFVIRPTWEEFESQPGDLVIVLDPGQAFGTGDHPTTRMCLELLETADVAGKRVADVGCGSGILSIGACLLGAASVDAVDIEDESVAVTRENAELNGVRFRAVVGEGVRSLFEPETDAAARVAAQEEWDQDEYPLAGAAEPSPPAPSPLASREGFDGTKTVAPRAKGEGVQRYDLVVSNIISAVLIRIARDVAEALKIGGEWVVSGIIATNWPDVLTSAERAGFELRERREEGDWVAARFSRVA